jgi:predicted transcriptional regulator
LRTPLTGLEDEIMHAIWRAGAMSVDAVRKALAPSRELKDSTIRTMLHRLETKGYVARRTEEGLNIYAAVEPSRSLAARAVRQIIDGLCRGSVEELITGMVDAQVLSRRELDELSASIARHRKESKR